MYILHNQDGYFLAKSGEWLDGSEPNLLFRTEHKDEAVNQLFEANTQNHHLRINIVSCTANAKKHPIIPTDELAHTQQTPSTQQDLLNATHTTGTTPCNEAT